MTRWLETDTFTDKDISAPVVIGSYASDGDRLVKPQLLLSQVAGNGDYVYYVTLQVGGSGAEYVMGPKTTHAVASGETAIGAQGDFVFVRSGDVLKVYVDGLAGDNANPDTIVRWCELAALRPTTADRTLDVSSGGEAGIDWGNVGSPTTTVGLSGTTVKTATDVETDTADIQTRLPAALVSGRVDASTGAMAANVVTAAALATDAITEIWAGSTAPNAATIASQVRMELATELARLDEDVSAGAHAGDAMTLADDAITAAKYDEATAHPLAQADAGSTAVARTGADADTLKTLSDEIAGIEAGSGLTAQETRDAMKLAPSAGAAAAGSIDDLLADMPATILTTAVAAYAGTPGTFGYLLSLLAGLDFTQVNLVAASNAGEITIKRTLTLAAVVSGLTIPADWTACYWTVKRGTDDADADALVQILVSNPPDADDGLLVLAGEAADDESAGSLTVNQALGTVTIALDDASTAALDEAVELVWDVKVHAPGVKTQPGAGTATISTAVTWA